MIVSQLRHIADIRVSNIDKKIVDGEQPVRLVNYVDVYYNDVISSDMALMSASASSAQVRNFGLVEGDSLITKDSETSDDIAVPAFVGSADSSMVSGYHLALLRPKMSMVSPKYLFWCLKSSALREQFSVRANGVTRFGLTYEAILGATVNLCELDKQRRIADFLDDQVARIDGIVAAREKQIECINAMRSGLLPGFLLGCGADIRQGGTAEDIRIDMPAGWRVGELGHLVDQLTNGYVGPTRDILTDSGVRYVQSLHIKNGRIDFERRPYFVSDAWHIQRPRIALRANDILIVQTGDIGSVALVPAGFGKASCHALLIARPRTECVTPAYLAEYLRSAIGYQEMIARATGALHPHLESGIKSIPIVVPPMDVQRSAVEEVGRAELENAAAMGALRCVVERMMELKRSIITAAVSGEFDVTAADGSQVPV